MAMFGKPVVSKPTPAQAALVKEYGALDRARQRNPHCVIRRSSGKEWRVNLHGAFGGSEDTACYETDLKSAIGTMDAIERWFIEKVDAAIANMFGD